jgi:hypothetical protein
MGTSTKPQTMRYIGNNKEGMPITTQQAMNIWKIYLENEGIEDKVDFVLTSAGPIGEIIELIKRSDPNEDILYLAAGAKDAARYDFMLNNEKYNPNKVEINIEPTPTVIDANDQPMSATIFRDALADRERNAGVIEDYIPVTSRKDIDKIVAILFNREDAVITEKKSLTMHSLFSLVEEVLFEREMTKGDKNRETRLKKKMDKDPNIKQDFIDRYGKEEGEKIYFATIRKRSMKEEEEEDIEEASTSGGSIGRASSVEGYSGSKRKKPGLIREED